MNQKNKKILLFVHHEYEDMELQYPKYRLMEAGYQVMIAGPEKGEIYQGKHGYPCQPDLAIREVQADQFEALVIPGGYAPDKLRRDPKVLELTRQIYQAGKVVAFICHAGWVPISAKIIEGIRCTSAPAIKDDLINAGALWTDEPVVVDRHVVSSRGPHDLPSFCRDGILKLLQEGPVKRS